MNRVLPLLASFFLVSCTTIKDISDHEYFSSYVNSVSSMQAPANICFFTDENYYEFRKVRMLYSGSDCDPGELVTRIEESEEVRIQKVLERWSYGGPAIYALGQVRDIQFEMWLGWHNNIWVAPWESRTTRNDRCIPVPLKKNCICNESSCKPKT